MGGRKFEMKQKTENLTMLYDRSKKLFDYISLFM